MRVAQKRCLLVYILSRLFDTVAIGAGPLVYSTVVVVVLAVGASVMPALRAAFLSPLTVLREGS